MLPTPHPLVTTQLKKILVTGASGFLGRQLCLDLVEQGYSVTALCRTWTGQAIEGLTLIVRDFNTPWDESGFPNQVDAILHLAQSRAFREFPEKAQDVFQVNVASTARLLDYAKRKGVGKFILASTGGLYGYGDTPHSEEAPIPIHGEQNYYFASKKSSELLATCYGAVFPVVILRFFYLYGPGQERTMLLPRLMDNIGLKKPILLDGEEGLRINPIHVRDASAATIAALQSMSSEGIYNIAGNEVLSIRQIAEEMGRALNIPPVFLNRSEQSIFQIGDNRKMRQDLHCPTWKLIDCLDQICM